MIFKWTPRDGAVEKTLTCANLTESLEARGQVVTTGSLSISDGLQEFASPLDSRIEYRVRLRMIDRTVSPDWDNLIALINHADAGGSFQWSRSASKVLDTTMSGAEAAGSAASTAIGLASTAGIAAGDWLYLEDLTDKYKWEVVRADAIPGDVTVKPGIVWDYVSGSICRHWEHFPACVTNRQVKIEERPAGRGVDRWDLDLSFMTVR